MVELSLSILHLLFCVVLLLQGNNRAGVFIALIVLEGRSPESTIKTAEGMLHICARCHVLSVLSHG